MKMTTNPEIEIDIKNSNQITDERRLWIGNLDPRISEYQLLKLMQKHGPIEKFDLLFHRTGPLAGQPRGYAFVTYINKEDAVHAKVHLNNMVVGSKNIVATWAHSNMTGEEVEKPKVELNIPALSMAKPEKKTDRDFQIQAIEAKLKLMEHSQNNELVINKTVATEIPVITQFQHNKQQTSQNNSRSRNNFKKVDRNHKPYTRHKNRR